MNQGGNRLECVELINSERGFRYFHRKSLFDETRQTDKRCRIEDASGDQGYLVREFKLGTGQKLFLNVSAKDRNGGLSAYHLE